jgi:hypothetical protein
MTPSQESSVQILSEKTPVSFDLVQEKVVSIKSSLAKLKQEAKDFGINKKQFSEQVQKEREQTLKVQHDVLQKELLEAQKLIIDARLQTLDEVNSKKLIALDATLKTVSLDLENLKHESFWSKAWNWVQEHKVITA